MKGHNLGTVSYSLGFKSMLVLPLAAIFTLGLFSLLAGLTSREGSHLEDRHVVPELAFLTVRQDSEPLTRKRRQPLPEEPSKVSDSTEDLVVNEFIDFQIPQMQVESMQVRFEMPNVDLGLAIDMRPALSNISAVRESTQMFAVDIPFQKDLKATKDVAPRYPSRALRTMVEGRVVAEFLVDTEGSVKVDSIRIVEANPEGIFEKEVLLSLKRSRFEHMTEQGEGLVYRARKAYNFQIPK